MNYALKSIGAFFCYNRDLTLRWKKQDSVLYYDKHWEIILNLILQELEKRDLQLDDQDEQMYAIEVLTRLCVNAPPLEQIPVHLCTTNSDADAFNQRCLGKLKSEAHVFIADIAGKFPESDYPTPKTLSLKIGARVMTLTNKRGFLSRMDLDHSSQTSTLRHALEINRIT